MVPHLDIRPAAPTAQVPLEASRLAASGLTAAATAVALHALGPSRGEVRAMAHPASWAATAGFEDALVQAAGLAAWACLLWLTGGIGLLLVARVPGAVGRLGDRLAVALLPLALRRAVEATLGVALVAGTVSGPAPASAQAPTPTPTPATASGAGPLERPVPTTPSPLSSAAPSAPSRPGPATAGVPPLMTPATGTSSAPAPVVVEPGDCLWRIAADYLGDAPDDAAVDRAWRRWYAANRRVVGADPDLIHPGQRLVPPPDAGTSTTRDAGGQR